MPCHVAWHPSDADILMVRRVRKEGRILCYHIRNLSTALEEPSDISSGIQAIMKVLEKPVPLEMVAISGLDSHTTEDPKVVAEKVRKARAAAEVYRALFNTLTAEMCRLCKLSEQKPGKFLDRHMAEWWKQHRESAGHED